MEKLYTRKGFNLVVIFVDLIIIYSSILLSYFLFGNNLEAYEENFYAFIYLSPYIGLFYLILNQIFELDKPRYFNFFGVAYSVALAIICLFLATMAMSFLTRKFAYPRSILITSSFIQILLLSSWHYFVNRKFFKENTQKSILIIGYKKAKELAYKLLISKGIWTKVKYVTVPEHPGLMRYIKECDVIFLSEDIDENKKQEIIEHCVVEAKNVFYEPKSPEILLFNTNFTQIDDVPILRVKSLYLGTASRIIKRIMDIVLSLMAAVVFFIPGVIIAILLKIEGGSVFYKQERITLGGKSFMIYKFRTMIENAEASSGPVLAQAQDNRITKLGHIMRTTRLDEIPQIINILKGQMSIVGPRPERPYFVEQFKREIPEYDLRHRVKAGLTGLAQIQGKYNTSVKDKLKYDLLYINGYTLALDIKLIMQTLNILLRKSSTEGVKSNIDYEKEIEKLIRDNIKEDSEKDE